MPASRVHRLSTLLANQIAAGEVVERPASVAKELVENSLDAGAGRIVVDVEGGGARLVRVRDDGLGIHREDLRLALSRHATSKISGLDDLERVGSLGFRGEALPSIASVSRLALSSRTGGDETGWRVEASGRDDAAPGAPVAVGHPPGTTVEVADLFYNTPARRRFLRTERTEFRHLEEVVRRAALAAFEVGFRLRHNDRPVLDLAPATDPAARLARVARLCGKGFSGHAVEVAAEASGLRLTGWVAGPGDARTQTDAQHFFVNRRPVRDALVRHGIRLAYEELLPAGQHGAYVLFLELAPEQVDVNVHPTKNEVRFREARLVHDFLVSCVRRALGGGGVLAPSPSPPAPPAMPSGPATRSRTVGEPRPAYPTPVRPPRARLRSGGDGTRPAGPPPLGRAVAGVDGSYVVAAADGGLVLVDVAAARERIAGRRIAAALDGGGLRGQPLLVPAALDLSRDEIEGLEPAGGLLERLGISVRRTGPEAAVLAGMPAIFRPVAPTALVRAVLAGRGSGAGGGGGEPGTPVPAGLVAALTALVARETPAPESLDDLNAVLRELERWDGDGLVRPVGVRLTGTEVRRLIRSGS